MPFDDSHIYGDTREILSLFFYDIAMPRGFYDAACLCRKSLNPSGVNWLSRGLRGAEMLFPSCRREIFKLPLPPRSLFVNAARFALICAVLAPYHALIDISFSTYINTW